MPKKLEICFISSITDLNVGSFRIWINDLSQYLHAEGIKVQVNQLEDVVGTNLVIILGKSDVDQLYFYKNKYPKNVIGIINPEGNLKYDADFIIVGSVEEKDSLSKNKYVFIFPLIEKKYSAVSKKVHSHKEKLVIGMHGSHTHLAKLRPHLKIAIEELNKVTNVHLKVITNPKAPKWKYGRPKIQNLELIEWNYETFSDEIFACDIGIVPNITDIKPIFQNTSTKLGLYNTDYFFRLKNKSNAGRIFVFIQHGIPVVADFTPSNMHILANPDNGYAVFSKEGWLNAFVDLLDHDKRNDISKNALQTFQKNYNPSDWAINLIREIQRVPKYVENNI